eukprot:9035532-Pyramimonas_sp.AAC.1
MRSSWPMPEDTGQTTDGLQVARNDQMINHGTVASCRATRAFAKTSQRNSRQQIRQSILLRIRRRNVPVTAQDERQPEKTQRPSKTVASPKATINIVARRLHAHKP